MVDRHNYKYVRDFVHVQSVYERGGLGGSERKREREREAREQQKERMRGGGGGG